MTQLSPQAKVKGKVITNNASTTRPVLGNTPERLGLRPFGRPASAANVKQVSPAPFIGGASSGQPFFVPEKD